MTIALILMSIAALTFFIAWRYECRQHSKTLFVASEKIEEAWGQSLKDLDKIEELEKHIAAIEQGRDEETECYEAQYLSFEDITKALNQQIIDLKQDNGAYRIRHDLHLMYCLPNLLEIDRVIVDMETAIEQMDDTPIFNSVLSYMG